MPLVFAAQAQYAPPESLADVRIPGLNESSGLAASRRHPGVFWSHNDSGGGPWLWAFDRRGVSLGRWRVRGARNFDWEDIALGPGPRAGVWYLYIGDIGDNQRNRESVTVYRIPEPDPASSSGDTASAESLRFAYPDGPQDAEALMVHPRTGDLYIIGKARGPGRETVVWKAAAPFRSGRKTMMRRIAAIRLPESLLSLLIPAGVTGGDISPDGKRVALIDYVKAWEAVLPKNATNFDAIWTAEWRPVETGVRAQGEAIAYRHDGQALLATSEGESFPLVEMVRSGQAP